MRIHIAMHSIDVGDMAVGTCDDATWLRLAGIPGVVGPTLFFDDLDAVRRFGQAVEQAAMEAIRLDFEKAAA